MRYLLLRWLAALVCLSVFSVRQTSAAPKSDQPDDPNFSGAWALDLKASTSFETLMKQIGAGLLERKYAASVKLACARFGGQRVHQGCRFEPCRVRDAAYFSILYYIYCMMLWIST